MDKKTILLEMLDAIYRDIRAMETEYGLKASQKDLRPPIESYHDAIRAWSGEGRGSAALTVASVSHDMTSIRRRSRWVASGPHIYWEDGQHDYKEQQKQARDFKRRLIRDSGQLSLPSAEALEDLHLFHDRYGHQTEALRQELRYRQAERYRPPARASGQVHGSWEKLEPEDYLSGIVYLGGFFARLKMAGNGQQPRRLTSSSASAASGLPAVSPEEAIRDQGERALRNMWVQIMHPLSLRASISSKTRLFGGKTQLLLDEHRHVPESEWQKMASLGLRMGDAYDHYAVLFAAALADSVNANYKEELADLDQLVRDTARLMHQLDDMEKQGKKIGIAQLERLLHEVTNPEVKARIKALLDSLRVDTSTGETGGNKLPPAKAVVQGAMRQAEHEVDMLEQRHTAFLSGQLSVYENAKDFVRQLASQGINLAGKFTEAAVSVSTGRGKGNDRGR